MSNFWNKLEIEINFNIFIFVKEDCFLHISYQHVATIMQYNLIADHTGRERLIRTRLIRSST